MNVNDILPLVNRPSRYCGNEHNAVHKEWDSVDLHVALAFPDLYEIGMSHQGIQILYHILNNRSDILAERVYAPDKDMERLLREKGRALFSLESSRSLADFDMLGITLPYELCYTNILTIIDLAGIPLHSSDRDDTHPLVIAGGPCAFNPEPVAEFFDAVLIGDGEEAIVEIADVLLAAKQNGLSRQEKLERLSNIVGVYVPAFFATVYDGDKLLEIKPLKEGYAKVRRAVIADLNEQVSMASKPIVPQTRIVHDRLGVELARGCTRGCRFCQAGIIYRPVRERTPEKILELAQQGIDNSGFDELALLSLSTGDYSCLAPLLVKLMDHFAKEQVSVSMPSMRVGTLTPEIMEQVKRVRKTGFTIAPEAGTDRLRQVINKGITEEDLLDTVQTAFSLGWKLIKLYFMFGLPLETDEDIAAIGTLVAKAIEVSGCKGGGKRKSITVSAGTFVPKPHTPFQWHQQLTIDESFAKIDALKQVMPKGAKLKWHDPRMSFLEGVFSRGDRRLSAVIEEAWQQGARLDAWSELYSLRRWMEAAEAVDIDLSAYLRARDLDEVLPWQHIDPGVDEKFLRLELAKAEKLEYTPDCRNNACQKCGLCDFSTIKPMVYNEKTGIDETQEPVRSAPDKPVVDGTKHYHYWVGYKRVGQSRFLGHLELLQLVFRGLKRAGLPVLFSQGFNPSPKVSFSAALPVGTVSFAEFFIVDVGSPLTDLEKWTRRLSESMPLGIEVESFKLGPKKQPEGLVTDYLINCHVALDSQAALDFMASDSFKVELLRKRKKRILDVRPLVKNLSVNSDGIVELSIVSGTGVSGIKPVELVSRVFGMASDDLLTAEVTKLSWNEL